MIFPGADTGVILVFRRAAEYFVTACRRGRAIGGDYLKDPLRSLSSFIGIDARIRTMNIRANSDQSQAD